VDRERRDDDDVRARVAETFRLEYARVVASVLRLVRDVDAAEEVVQDAFAQALDRWPADGTPGRLAPDDRAPPRARPAASPQARRRSR
jgi:RNA polymerase sigma-70 factor (ECF subfamily)